MAGNVIEKPIGQIQKLRPYLPKKSQEELDEILVYGEKMKAEGERKKKERWSDHSREDFENLLRYKWRNKKEIEGQYKYLDVIKGLERKKFIEEYLRDDMLYSGEIDRPFEKKSCPYEAWKKGEIDLKKGMYLDFSNGEIRDERLQEVSKMELKECVELDLSWNNIGDEGAEVISKMELKEGVKFNLEKNQIGAEGVKAISKMELKEGVTLDLGSNLIGDEGVDIIVKNMELKEGVSLYLSSNGIGDRGARALSKVKFKDGVRLYLWNNSIGDEGIKALAENLELQNGMKIDLRSNQIGDEGAKAIMEKLKVKSRLTIDIANNKISPVMKEKLNEWAQGVGCSIYV